MQATTACVQYLCTIFEFSQNSHGPKEVEEKGRGRRWMRWSMVCFSYVYNIGSCLRWVPHRHICSIESVGRLQHPRLCIVHMVHSNSCAAAPVELIVYIVTIFFLRSLCQTLSKVSTRKLGTSASSDGEEGGRKENE